MGAHLPKGERPLPRQVQSVDEISKRRMEMNTIYLVKVKSKTRMSDSVRSQPWWVESAWGSMLDAQYEVERLEAEGGEFDYMIEAVDFYPAKSKEVWK